MFSRRFEELSSAVAGCSYTRFEKVVEETEALQYALRLLALTRLQKGIVYVIGNGGSAGIASHFSNDLMKALQVPSQTLYDTNLVTCISNDLGYDQVFSYPLERLLRPQDLLVAISSSGKSSNIINAAQVALSRKIPLITLTGFTAQNPLRAIGDLNFWIDRTDYGLVETSHFFLLHTLIDLWNKNESPTQEIVSSLYSTKSNQDQNI